jgi:hypothetical protein
MAGIKIVDLPAVGRDLAATDLFEMSLVGGTGSRKITGQEIMNASKLSVNNTPVINGTAGRIFFQDAANVLQQSANLFWDATNNRLGIGTETPLRTMDVRATQSVVRISSTTNTNSCGLVFNNFAGDFWIGRDSSAGNGFGMASPAYAGVINARGNYPLYIGRNDSNDISIFTTGNIGINTTTDAGYKLDVNGTMIVRGAAVGATDAFRVTRSDGTMLFYVQNNASSFFSGPTYFSSPLYTNNIQPLQNQNLEIQAIWAGSTHVRIRTITNTAQVLIVEPAANLTLASGTQDTQRILHTFAPTSGTGVANALTLNQTINQTGGANGITRGLYIAPTLTAAADFRAIETTAGNVLFNGGNVAIGTTTALEKLQLNGGICFGTSNNATINSGIGAGNHTYLQFATLGVNVMRISANQNVLIGTTTDAGYKLDVNGTARFIGRIDAGSFTPGAAASQYTIATTGRICAGSGIFFRTPIVGDTALTGFNSSNNDTQINVNINNQVPFVFSGTGGSTATIALATPGFNPTSGTGDKSIFAVGGTYQTSGTYSGIIRGFYYNPNLVSMTGVTAHYAWHSVSGRFKIEGLPTSPTGLTAGELWNNGGVINIV